MQRRFLMTPICLSIMALLVNDVNAHPGHSHRRPRTQVPGAAVTISDRVWTDNDGSVLVRGSFVSVRDDQLQVRRADDTLVSVGLLRLSNKDRTWVEQRQLQIRVENDSVVQIPRPSPTTFCDCDDEQFHLEQQLQVEDLPLLLAQLDQDTVKSVRTPEIAKTFEAFVRSKAIKTHWDDRYFYVESNGIPDHRLMVGITAWQQQVPIPQKYFGENAWRIPLNPVPAANPRTTRNEFLRGAIALAANGVPIFNPLNNRGDDAYLFGELDEFGGHCGRADDYHYHIAPVHLEKAVGKGLPIAYALDGYPIYGYEEPDGSPVVNLDKLNGHKGPDGRYHYHATKEYPYLNGGFHGEVTEREGQVDPQPRAEPIRPFLRPLRDAKIIDFAEVKPKAFQLTYEIRGKKGTVSYVLADDGSASFTFVDTDGQKTTETYSPPQRGSTDRRPPSQNNPGPPPGENRQSTNVPSGLPKLVVTSSSVDVEGYLSIDCTCDGAGRSPAVEWKGAPEGTKSFAISIWHVAPDREKSYLVVYNIPPHVSKIAEDEKGVGVFGHNDRRQAAFDPMCSKGPGRKSYNISVYALSSELKLTPGQASRPNLLQEIKQITLAEGTKEFRYERKR
jgi:phosphatidylethanolamine-binding protein (PEBP) family uncharacterized protein